MTRDRDRDKDKPKVRQHILHNSEDKKRVQEDQNVAETEPKKFGEDRKEENIRGRKTE